MTTRAPIPVAMLADRWVALVLVENGVEIWLDLGPGDLGAALAVMLFVRDGARPERLVWGHQRPALARIVASYDDLVGPNDFARWLARSAADRDDDLALDEAPDVADELGEVGLRGSATGGDASVMGADHGVRVGHSLDLARRARRAQLGQDPRP